MIRGGNCQSLPDLHNEPPYRCLRADGLQVSGLLHRWRGWAGDAPHTSPNWPFLSYVLCNKLVI